MNKFLRLNDAIIIATIYHNEQYRRDGMPYITHPLRVMQDLMDVCRLFKEDIYDFEDYLCIAVLHDLLEDTIYDPNELKRKFGTKIYWGVEALTDRHKEGNRAKRVKNYHDQVVDAAKQDPYIAAIKLADKIDNLYDCKKGDFGFFKSKYINESQHLLKCLEKFGDNIMVNIMLSRLSEAIDWATNKVNENELTK